jgi:drug/metabolite transporter (DMT)-like permease
MLSLGVMTFSFKVMHDHMRHTIFEDIYGRGVIFFICSAFYYWRNKAEGNSVFDIKPHIRFLFLSRVIFISLAYIFLYLSIMNTSSFVYVALILCMLYPIFKFMSRYSLVDVGFTIYDTFACIISIAGMVFLYNGKQLFSPSRALDFDN